jgi:flagellar biosynthetic protein FliP
MNKPCVLRNDSAGFHCWLAQQCPPVFVAALLFLFLITSPALAQSPGSTNPPSPPPAPLLPDPVAEALRGGPESWTSPQKLSSTLQVMLLLTVLSLAPAILLMTTSFVRIVVVLGLLRQALGTQQLPPSQVMTTLAMFMTLLIMGPTWTEIYTNSIQPYTRGQMTDPETAWNAGVVPLKRFMSRQIEAAGNSDDVWLFYEYLPENQRSSKPPEVYEEVPLVALLPAFMLSELKVAFLIGFQIYLPFLILDLVVSSITISMGMMMLPPVMISLPLKLLLFVLVDGWTLIVGMLLESFG